MTSDVNFFNLQLQRYVRTMEKDGLLDANFLEARAMKEDNGSFFFADLIPSFCNVVEAALKEMTQIMDQDTIDYERLYYKCIKLKGSTSCFGISRLLTAINELLPAVRKKSKEGCDLGLQRFKDEYDNLHEKLQIVHQMEKRTLPRRST